MGWKIGTIAALALATWAGSAGAQELWRGARGGMTVDEVIKTIPGAALSDDRTISEGRVRGAIVEGITLQSKSWSAGFYFRDGRLDIVILEPDSTVSKYAFRPMFRPVANDLREVYGEPFSCDASQFGEHCEWRWPDRSIMLSYSDIYGDMSLEIYYERRSSSPQL
ncbi:hypothetical protein QOZ96_003604 [Brevundimonas nasdae]|uniref:hypothetical protein n=1 Tax=Brevundimonas nasdae TaxID=172043 RepID=UPI001913B641|nr:hypothetical protein [Brevundimonas nasdae]MBK6024543.1 hypothetical protein [Brevundimonas nasdae]MDQ0453631.1 hypothetical protein [Brevundimonas nasdae]